MKLLSFYAFLSSLHPSLNPNPFFNLCYCYLQSNEILWNSKLNSQGSKIFNSDWVKTIGKNKKKKDETQNLVLICVSVPVLAQRTFFTVFSKSHPLYNQTTGTGDVWNQYPQFLFW